MTNQKSYYTRQMDAAREQPAPKPTEIETAEAQTGLVRRIVAFDVGDRRIGVAISDPLGYTAQPLLTMHRAGGKGGHRTDMKSIARLLRKHAVAEAVVGNPLHMSGDQSPQAAKAQHFAEELRAQFGLTVHLWDERLTTTEAHRHLNTAGYATSHPAGRERKQIIDQVAAVLILQSFLNARTNQDAREKGDTAGPGAAEA